ncbi:MAG: SGNH/GDSL hydrolase family protein [Bacteroidetes bacterium]|nr:MAG: SGNH/GDSL hydrolase family protein [Bacteroidota bacterium]
MKKGNDTKKADNIKTNKKNIKPVYLIFIFIILFIFQEIIFRIIFPIPEILNFNRINYSPVFFEASSSELKYLENASFIWASDPDGVESLINLNIYGFRGNDFNIKPDRDKTRIAFMGDSFVEGYLAKDDEMIISVFGNEAKRQAKNYELLNFGIGGSDFSTYCGLLCDMVPIFKPDHVILILHGNDLPPSPYNPEWLKKPLEPEYSHWWVPRIYYVLKNVIQKKTVAHWWISKPFTFFAPVPAPSNPWSNTEKASRYEKFISPKVAEAIKKGRFNPFAVDEYSQFKEHLPEVLKITPHLNGIENFMALYGKKIYIVYVPSRNQVSPYYLKFEKEFSTDSVLVPLTDSIYNIHAKILKENCKSLGIPFYDCTEIIRNEENIGNHLYWNYDEHMRPKGYALLGKAIYEWWKNAKDLY